jgi:hypothetical protein
MGMHIKNITFSFFFVIPNLLREQNEYVLTTHQKEMRNQEDMQWRRLFGVSRLQEEQ